MPKYCIKINQQSSLLINFGFSNAKQRHFPEFDESQKLKVQNYLSTN
jgi:hypothetical protein